MVSSTKWTVVGLLAAAALCSCNLIIGLEAGERAPGTTAGGTGGTHAGGGGTGGTHTGGASSCDDAVGGAGEHIWSHQFGDAAYQYATALAMASDGSVVVTGGVLGTVDFGGGHVLGGSDGLQGDDVFVLKLGCDGSTQWATRFGGGDPLAQHGYAVAVDHNGDVLVTGSVQGTVNFGGGESHGSADDDIFVLKLAGGSGGYVWAKRFGDTAPQSGKGIAVDAQNGVYVVGTFQGTVDFGLGAQASSGGDDLFLVKLAGGSGNGVWNEFATGPGSQQARGVAVSPAGDKVVVATCFDGDLTFGPSVSFTNLGALDFAILTIGTQDDFACVHCWNKRFGGVGSQCAESIATDQAGNVVVGGDFEVGLDVGINPTTALDLRDAFVAELDGNDGHALWMQALNGPGQQDAMSVATDANKDVLVAGRFTGTITIDGTPHTAQAAAFDAFAVKLKGNAGAAVWSKAFGDGAPQEGRAVGADAYGNVLTAGMFDGTVQVADGVALTTAGSTDIYVFKFAP
jgi:hypothetical protein